MGLALFIIGTLGWHIGMYGMFKKAGIDAWKAFVPFYNTWEIVEKAEIKRFWFWLQLRHSSCLATRWKSDCGRGKL